MSSGENDPKKRRLHDLVDREEEGGQEDQDDDQEFEIERIVSRCLVEGSEDTFEYEVKWLGHSNQQNTWQREETLDSCKFWLAEFIRAEEFREKLEELKERERSRSAVLSIVTVAPVKPEVIAQLDIGGSGGVESFGGTIKTEPGLESENVINTGRPQGGFADIAQVQGQDQAILYPGPEAYEYHRVTHLSLKSPNNDPLQEANNALDLMKSKLEEKDKEIAELKKELLTFKLRNCMTDSKLDKQKKELDQAQAEILQLKTHLVQKDSLLSRLTPELQGLRDQEKTHDQLNLRLSGARQMLLDLQLKVNDLLSSNEQVKVNLLNKEELILTLNREKKLRKEEMDAQLETLTQAKSDNSDLSERVSELQFQLGAMQTENDQLRDNLSLTMVRMGKGEKERETLRKLYNEMINTPTQEGQDDDDEVPRWNDR